MRTTLAVPVLLCAAVAVADAGGAAFYKHLVVLRPGKFEVGQVGYFPEKFQAKVARILKDDAALVYNARDNSPEFLLTGFPFKGLADGSTIALKDYFEVPRTEKLASGQTLFVVRPITEAELEKRFPTKKK